MRRVDFHLSLLGTVYESQFSLYLLRLSHHLILVKWTHSRGILLHLLKLIIALRVVLLIHLLQLFWIKGFGIVLLGVLIIQVLILLHIHLSILMLFFRSQFSSLLSHHCLKFFWSLDLLWSHIKGRGQLVVFILL